MLLVSIDALRADAVSSGGSRWPTTPFLDHLAAEGARFSHAFVNTHGTPPSHTTMLSSRYQQEHTVGLPTSDGKPRLRIPAEVQMVQEILQASGWVTVGTTGGGYMSRAVGFERGFEHFDDAARSVEEGSARLVAAVGEAMASRRPVFAFLHTYQVHSPYLPPPAYRGRFGATDGGAEVDPSSEALATIQTKAGRVLSPAAFEFLEARYAEEVRHTDDVLGQTFAELRALGFLDQALVIVTADHGEEFGDHGWLLHGGRLFEELVHIPLIAWGERLPAGVVEPRLVSLVDVAPTILAAAGIEIPSAMHGRDLASLPPTPWQSQRVFMQYSDTLIGLRTPRWKLIEHLRDGTVQLFDLRMDPMERHSVHDRRPDLVTSLRAELEAWHTNLEPVATDPAAASLATLDDDAKAQLRALGYLVD